MCCRQGWLDKRQAGVGAKQGSRHLVAVATLQAPSLLRETDGDSSQNALRLTYSGGSCS